MQAKAKILIFKGSFVRIKREHGLRVYHLNDQVMARMQSADEKAKTYGGCGPRLNKPRDASYWLNKSGSPKAKLSNEKPQGETIDYDELIKRWQKG